MAAAGARRTVRVAMAKEESMRFRASLIAGTAMIPLLAGADPAGAHPSPPGCASNSIVLTPSKDRTLIRNGDRLT